MCTQSTIATLSQLDVSPSICEHLCVDRVHTFDAVPYHVPHLLLRKIIKVMYMSPVVVVYFCISQVRRWVEDCTKDHIRMLMCA